MNGTSKELPQFFELLNKEDKKQYLFMQLTLSSPVCKNRRNHSTQTFDLILQMIKNYAVRNDCDDWKRCIVCGIFWLENNQIAVNSKQLCVLLSKCKSSINGSLQALHYYKIANNLDHVKQFVKTIQMIQTHPMLIELRQWTIRRFEPNEKPPATRANPIIPVAQPQQLTPTVNLHYDVPHHDEEPQTYNNTTPIVGDDPILTDFQINMADVPDFSDYSLYDFTHYDYKYEYKNDEDHLSGHPII